MFLGMHLESASKQWGYNAYGSATATFPLTMSATYSIVLGHYATGSIDKWNWGINSYSTSKFTFTSMPGSYGIFWCVIGKQQWGRDTTSATFPISFTSVPFSLACTCGDGQKNNYCPSPHQNNLTATGFTYGDRGYWWVVIGKQ